MTDPEKIKNEDASRQLRNRRLKILAGIVAVIVLCNPITLLADFILLNKLVDTVVLHRFTQPFFDYPLPPDAYELGRESGVGGTGTDSCFFWAKRFTASPLSKEALEQYYGLLHLPRPHPYKGYSLEPELDTEATISIQQIDPGHFAKNIEQDTYSGIKSMKGLNLYNIKLGHRGVYWKDEGLSTCH